MSFSLRLAMSAWGTVCKRLPRGCKVCGCDLCAFGDGAKGRPDVLSAQRSLARLHASSHRRRLGTDVRHKTEVAFDDEAVCAPITVLAGDGW